MQVAILGLSKTSSATVRAQTKIVAYTVEVAVTSVGATAGTRGFPNKESKGATWCERVVGVVFGSLLRVSGCWRQGL